MKGDVQRKIHKLESLAMEEKARGGTGAKYLRRVENLKNEACPPARQGGRQKTGKISLGRPRQGLMGRIFGRN